MEPFNILVAALGGLVLALDLGSLWLEQPPIPLTLLALLFGVALGLAELIAAAPTAHPAARRVMLPRVVLGG